MTLEKANFKAFENRCKFKILWMGCYNLNLIISIVGESTNASLVFNLYLGHTVSNGVQVCKLKTFSK